MTSQTGELMDRDGMTGLAGGSVMVQEILSQRSGVCPHEDSLRPGIGVMALRAIRSKGAQMECWFRMTRNAICRDLERRRDMTLTANHRGMRARQREGAGIVIEDDVAPAGRGMADRAILSILAVMMVIFCVTGETIFRRAFEESIGMTRQTVHARVISDQREGCGVMVEFSSRPCGGLMACCAIPPELTFMDILRRVTGETIFGRVLVDAIDMACLARSIDVRARQHETGGIVIELGGQPRVRHMTRPTSRAQLTHVRIVLLMTGETIHWRAIEDSVHMASLTSHLNMRTGQFESRTVMVETGGRPAIGRMT